MVRNRLDIGPSMNHYLEPGAQSIVNHINVDKITRTKTEWNICVFAGDPNSNDCA